MENSYHIIELYRLSIYDTQAEIVALVLVMDNWKSQIFTYHLDCCMS